MDIRSKLEPEPESLEAIELNAIREERGSLSVFKTVNGRKIFLGIRKTRPEAEALYRSK